MSEHNGMKRTVLTERIYRAGYVVRTEDVSIGDDPAVTMRSAYTPSGDYIGSPADARDLVVTRGILPQLRTPTSNVCSIGYCPSKKKWFGWSHRAIFGFGVGAVVKAGDCIEGDFPVGFRATSITDAKRMAEAFAESVG